MVDAHLADQLQAVAHGVGGPFEHGADQVRPAVADGQADPAPLGVGVEVGGPLAGQVGQEEQALGARAGEGGLVGEQEVRVDALLPWPPRPRPCPARCGTTGSCRRPRARRPSRARRPARRGSRAGAGPAGRSRARRCGRRPRPRSPSWPRPRPGGRCRCPPRRPAGRRRRRRPACPSASPVASRPDRADLGRDLGALVARRQQRRVDVELAEQLPAPAAVGHVEQQRARGVADLGGVRPGQAVADVVLGQEDLADPVPVLRLVLADPEQLGGGEAGQRGVGRPSGSAPRARRPSPRSRRTRRRSAGRSRARRGGSPGRRRRGRPSRASGR